MNNRMKKKQKQFNNWLSKKEKRLFNQTVKQYNRQARKSSDKIANMVLRYGKDNKISYQKLMEKLSPAEARILTDEMNQFLLKNPSRAEIIALSKNVNNLSKLEGLQQSLKLSTLDIGSDEYIRFKNHLESIANHSFDSWSVYAKVKILDPNYRANQISQIVNERWYQNMNFSDRIWKNKERLADTLNNEVKNAFIRGDDYDKISKMIEKRFNVGAKDARRLVYTEGSRVMNESKARVFEILTDVYIYSTVGDNRVCGECEDLDGLTFKFSEREAGVNFPPMHPSCRCSFDIDQQRGEVL